MNWKNFARAFPPRSLDLAGVLIGSFYLAIATAGMLACTSCASTEKGLQREEVWLNNASNTIAILKPVAQQAPAPLGTALEGILAAAGALGALWATHVHRSLSELRASTNGNGKPAGAGPAPPAAKTG